MSSITIHKQHTMQYMIFCITSCTLMNKNIYQFFSDSFCLTYLYLPFPNLDTLLLISVFHLCLHLYLRAASWQIKVLTWTLCMAVCCALASGGIWAEGMVYVGLKLDLKGLCVLSHLSYLLGKTPTKSKLSTI